MRVGQRRARLLHRVDRHRAQCPADEVERPARLADVRLLQNLVERFSQTRPVAAQSGQAQRPDGQADRTARPVVTDFDQFQTATAKVRDHAACARKCAQHPPCTGGRLFFAAQYAGREAKSAQMIDEVLTVRRFAHGSGRHHVDPGDPQIGEDEGVSLHPPVGEVDGLLRQFAARCYVASEPGRHLLVQEDARGPCRAAIQYQPDGVGPDVDNSPLGCLAREQPAGIAVSSAQAQFAAPIGASSRTASPSGLRRAGRRRDNLGTPPASSAPPRPDSDGLVMK